MESSMISNDTRKDSEDTTIEFGKANSINIGISPVKIAQAERQSSTESEESSESSDEDQAITERSRPIIRSATPRRSASPMRRVQIGRSGSRRSTALTIKSLNYFPVRERIASNRDEDENSSRDEMTEQPTKKPENTVRRMSVQEAINLFESKQKDQNLDVQKRRALGEVSSSTNKAVLRRWSSGMSESLTCSQENASESTSQDASTNLVLGVGDNKLTDVKVESDIPPGNFSATESDIVQIVKSPNFEKDSSPGLVISRAQESDDRATASAEWSRRKEEELNQMLMNMMERRPGNSRGTNGGCGGSLSVSNEQRGNFYSQYKEKRDEKLRAENVKKHPVMETQLKVLQETLKQSKADMASKSGVSTKKLDWSGNSQQPRRNSSPPVLHKKEDSKAIASRKSLPKTSSLPTTRASWSSGTSLKASGVQQAKTSPRVTSANANLSRRKSQPTSSPTPPSSKTERALHQPKGKLEAKTDVKPTLVVQGEKKQKTTPRTHKTLKANAPLLPEDDSGTATAKPSFYNKVTKKSSVVPLEAKPFLKKGTRTRPGVGPMITKTKVAQSDASSKISDTINQAEEKEPIPKITESTATVVEVDLSQQANDVDADLDTLLHNDLNVGKTETLDQSLDEVDNGLKNSVEPPVVEIQPDESIGISSAAWVEVECEEVSTGNGTILSEASVSTMFAPLPLSSPRVRHSLSQMLQADSNEPEVIEWGNAENPPAMIYHKDAPKGLKRLLKFGRKTKGEANVTGWASPSVFSEGDDDTEYSKNLDTTRKAALQPKNYGQQKTMPDESLCDGNSSKRAVEYHGVHDVLSGSDKFQECHVSSTATSTKEGGEKKEDEANPFRWMIEGFSTLLNHTAVTHRSGNFAACGFTWNLQLEIKSSGEDDEKCLYLYLFSVEASSPTSSVVKATYELLMYDQLYGEHLQIKVRDQFSLGSASKFLKVMAKVLSTRSTSPRYVPILTEGGEKKAGEKTNPFRWMIEGFCTLLNQTAETHSSGNFAACGFTWKLQLEIKSSGEDAEKSLSLCLYSAEASSSTGSVVKANYKLLIYDQLYGEHIQKEGEGYFHGTSQYGLCCMVPLKKFNGPKSGLLVNDCCIFGAEVMEAFACKLDREGVSECLSMKKEITPQTYTWVIKNFSKLSAKQVSEVFTSGGYGWRLQLYPNISPYTNSLAMFMVLDNSVALPSKTRVYVDYSICLVDQINGKHEKLSVQRQFSSDGVGWGWHKFLEWKDMQNPSRGFLRNDTCIVEASVAVLGE
ncbi:hypothetical protein MUK42_16859, partial [Musa troglodytarum]